MDCFEVMRSRVGRRSKRSDYSRDATLVGAEGFGSKVRVTRLTETERRWRESNALSTVRYRESKAEQSEKILDSRRPERLGNHVDIRIVVQAVPVPDTERIGTKWEGAQNWRDLI